MNDFDAMGFLIVAGVMLAALGAVTFAGLLWLASQVLRWINGDTGK